MHIFPHWHAWHHFGCIQHTLPLLFDDCLTLLEKLDALWCKLNDLITDYDEFKEDFSQWKDEVEDTLDQIINIINDILVRLKKVEEDVADIYEQLGDIYNILNDLRRSFDGLGDTIINIQEAVDDLTDEVEDLKRRVKDLEDRMDDVEDRLDALEDLLNNLHIVVPEELFQENDIDWFISNVSTPWLQQMGLSTSVYTPLRKIVPVQTDVGTIPAVSLKVGTLGFPITYAKIPLMFSFQPGSNINSSATFLANIATDPTMKAFVKAVQDKATTADAAATITLANAPSFQPTDNIKFEGSYAIFQQPNMTSHTVGLELLTDDTMQGIRTANSVVSVRMALTQGSTVATMAIAVDKVCAYYSELDGQVYIMLLSEHQ